MIDVVIIRAGPAGVAAALRAADLGARTALVTRAEFGGMAANDGPAAVAVTARVRVDELAYVPLSFPTYAGIPGSVAASATRQLNRDVFWEANRGRHSGGPSHV